MTWSANVSPTAPAFVPDAHRFFSLACFNDTWTWIEKADRTPEETEQMVLLAHASMWHWTQRADVTDQNRSIGYWQLARVMVLAGEPAQALKFAHRCLAVSADLAPFYRGYAWEAKWRAEALLDDAQAAVASHQQAMLCLDAVEDDEERAALAADLGAG